MKSRCLRNCFIDGQIYLKGEEYELPNSLKNSPKFQPLGQPVEVEAEGRGPVHKHYYRRDGTCACGAKLAPAWMKRRELKAKKAKS